MSEPYYLTELDLGRCLGFPFKLGWLGDPKAKYGVGPFAGPESTALNETIEKAIRKDAKKFETSENPHPVKLSDKPPVIAALPIGGGRAYHVSFENRSEAEDPTQFVWLNGAVHMLAPAALLEGIFTLGDRVFVHYSFSCKVGCGWGGHIVYEVTATDARMVLFDDTGST